MNINKCELGTHLSVKRITPKLKDALELMGVALNHNQAVFYSLEDLSFIQNIKTTYDRVPLTFYPYISFPLKLHSQPG